MIAIRKIFTENILLKILALALAIAAYEALKPQADELHSQKSGETSESNAPSKK